MKQGGWLDDVVSSLHKQTDKLHYPGAYPTPCLRRPITTRYPHVTSASQDLSKVAHDKRPRSAEIACWRTVHCIGDARMHARMQHGQLQTSGQELRFLYSSCHMPSYLIFFKLDATITVSWMEHFSYIYSVLQK